ncbi:MAG: hypothetical protein Q7T81_17920 [Pseudolabrys sp.]|nr:hypothetical protein [Pseudolabrys sp.]
MDQRLNRIGQHIVRARLFLDLWFYFEGNETRPAIIDTMRKYNEFFRFTPHAYLLTYVIYMAGVFDKRKGTISLLPLIRDVKASGQLGAPEAEIVESLLEQATPIAEKITILRHNAFAHRSAHISYDDAFAIASVKPEELRNVTDTALEITNRLLSARSLQDQHFTKLPLEAAVSLMKALEALGSA